MTTATSGASGPAQAQEAPDPHRWIALGVVLTGAFIILLDVTIVVVAIPSIQRDLHASFAQIQWVLAGYQLAYAVTLITGGRMGDTFGRKRMFMAGMAGFVLMSAVCGLAQSPEMLVVSRVVQGLTAALMYPQVLSVIQVSFPARERATAFGIFGALIGIASIAGPLLGGVITQLNILGLGWRPIFLVNLPVGVAALAVAALQMRESRAPKAQDLDIPGVLIVSLGLFLLAYPLVEGREAGWPAWAYVMLALSVPVLALFGAYAVRRASRGLSPLVEPDLFKDRAFVVGVLLAMVFFSGVPSFFLTLSIFLQVGLGYSALDTGLTTAPFALAAFIASATSIRLAPRLGKRVLNVGSALLVAGVLLVGLTIQQVGTGISGYQLAPALFVSGLGMGLVVAPLVTIVLAGIHHGHAGSASGVLTTIQQIGAALGVAVIGVLFFGMISSGAGVAARAVQPQLEGQLLAAGFPQERVGPALDRFRLCFEARAREADPSVVPAICPSSNGPQSAAQTRIGAVFSQAAAQARARDFSDAFRGATLFNAAVFALTFLLAFLLPGPTPSQLRPAMAPDRPSRR